MAKKVKGIVAQFGTKGYGFITGDDGEKYFVHQKNIYNKARLKADTRVVFNAENSDKGLVAVDVKLEKSFSSSESTPLSDASIKTMFLFLLAMQIIMAYYVFIAPVVK
ncbi:MAG: cold shock domain-containing protein [Candidatus Thioglobus sp.]|nr:cold shock domain-containing protein [Candidatus Thioglobus sp.]